VSPLERQRTAATASDFPPVICGDAPKLATASRFLGTTAQPARRRRAEAYNVVMHSLFE
jgi:hypothetical protein